MAYWKALIKKVLPRTLFGRSLLILIVPILLIQLIMTYVFFDRHWGRMTMRLASSVAGEVALVVDAYDTGMPGTAQMVDYAAQYLDMRIEFAPEQGLPETPKLSVSQVWEYVVSDTLERELASVLDEPFTTDFDFGNKSFSIYVALESGVLSFDLPQRRLFSSSGYIFLLWVIGASCLLLFISIMFMRNQIRPIRKLAVAAERFGKGQDVPTYRPSGAKEIRQASRAFLEMQRRIKRQVAQRTDMLAGISHDLRTPLTRLKLELEMLSARHDVAAMKGDIEDMERMIGGYLEFVRGEGEDEQFVFVDIAQVLERMAGGFSRQDVKVHYHPPAEAIRLRLRPVAFERAVSNILSNAAKYADSVWVGVYEEGGKAYITIEDDGPGIPEDLHKEVFKPFKRVDSSRNAETGGVGLGLSIAMDIIQAHGGMIELSRSAHGGLKAVIRLPL